MKENKKKQKKNTSSLVKWLPGQQPHKTDQSRGLQYNKKTTELANIAPKSYL